MSNVLSFANYVNYIFYIIIYLFVMINVFQHTYQIHYFISSKCLSKHDIPGQTMLIMCPIVLFPRVSTCLVSEAGTSIIECIHFHTALRSHICHMATLLSSLPDTSHLPFYFSVVSNCQHIPNSSFSCLHICSICSWWKHLSVWIWSCSLRWGNCSLIQEASSPFPYDFINIQLLNWLYWIIKTCKCIIVS